MRSVPSKILLLVVVAALSFVGLPAASGGAGGSEGPLLDFGPWEGTGQITEDVSMEEDEFSIRWTGTIDAAFRFIVADFDSGPRISGDWDLAGPAHFTIESDAFVAEADVVYTGDGQFVEGPVQRRIELEGAVHASGTASIALIGAEATQTVPVEVPIDPNPIFIEIKGATCNEAYGVWAQDIEVGIADAGFDVQFDGPWMALRDTGVAQEELEELLEGASSSTPDDTALESSSPLFKAAATLLRSYNAYIDHLDYESFDAQGLYEILTEAERLLNLIRNLSECDQKLFGEENVEIFVNALTFVIQGLVVEGAIADAPAEAWQHLLQVAGRTGAMGPGAPNPAAAVQTEQALIDRAEEILQPHVTGDGVVAANRVTEIIMSAGAAMGWTFSVNGHEIDARGSYWGSGDDG